MPNRLQRQRIKFWHQNPNCHWCGCATILLFREKADTPILNEATIDHIYSKFDPKRSDHTLKHKHVLSCWKCNNQRAKQEELSLPKGILHAQSNSPPLQERSLNELLRIENILIRNGDPKSLRSLVRIQKAISERTINKD